MISHKKALKLSEISNETQISAEHLAAKASDELVGILSKEQINVCSPFFPFLLFLVLSTPVQRSQIRTTSSPAWINPTTENSNSPNHTSYRNVSQSYRRIINESIAEPPEDADESIFEQSTVLEQTVLEPLPIIENKQKNNDNNKIEIPEKFLQTKKYKKPNLQPPTMIQNCKDLLQRDSRKFSSEGKKLLENVIKQMEADFRENKERVQNLIFLI